MTPTQSTRERIAPIIYGTYGENHYVRDCVTYLTEKIDTGAWDSRGREYMVMIACWDWFSGGTTAESTARKIEEALA